MAVNFPDSPSNGDTFVVGSLTYTYTASTDVWDASGVTSAAIQISDTAPSNPSDGELWHNSSDLKLYIYYNDGSSSQWVVASPQQIGPAGPGGSFSGTVSQSIIPDTDSAYDLGSATNKFRSLYLSSDTLYLGDSASISAGSGGEIILPSIKLGRGANAVRLEADAAGKLKTKKVVGGVTQAAEEPGKATVVTDMAGLIAVTGMSAGQTALVTTLNKVFMYTGSAWYLIATMTNASPTAITGVDATYDLATDGTATTITAVSTDPEGFPLTWSYAVTTGSLGSTATVSQADNVFTITPSTTEADAGTFSITFSVTDGATGAVSVVSAFTLSFGWADASHQQTLVPSIGTTNTGSTNAYARVGSSVAIDGDTLVVGGWGYSGHVWVFTRSGNTWTEQQQLVASDQANGDEFGYAVDISGDTIIIGARQEEADGTNHGSVYIFNRSGTTWSQESKLYPSNMNYSLNASSNTSSVYFGADVAIDGDDIIIGIPNYDVGTSLNRGETVTARRTGTTVTNTLGVNQWSTRNGTGGGSGDNTGEYVDICKDSNGKPVIAISMNKSDTYASDAGYISIYKMNSNNTLYSHQADLVPSDIQASDQVGRPDLDYYNGSYTLAVGVPHEDTGGTSAGAVYIFTSTTGESGTWSQQQKIQASSTGASDYFGFSVSVSGDSLVVGAQGDDDTVTNAGAIYIFERTGTTWTQSKKLQAPTPEGSGTFGRAVAMDGDYIVVGARDNPLTATLSGASYVYAK